MGPISKRQLRAATRTPTHRTNWTRSISTPSTTDSIAWTSKGKPEDEFRHGEAAWRSNSGLSLASSAGNASFSQRWRLLRRLPGHLWAAAADKAAPAIVSRHVRHGMRRVAQLASANLLDRGNIALLGGASAAVLGCGVCEGWLLTVAAAPAQEVAWFAILYGTENMLPSVIWSTKPALLVADAHGYPAELLIPLPAAGPEEAAQLLRAESCRTYRSIVAGYVGMAQVLRVVQGSARAAAQLQQRVLLGLEPPLRGVHERVIRLCGVRSDVTSLSLARYGEHVLPVFETVPNSPARHAALLLGAGDSYDHLRSFHAAAGHPDVSAMALVEAVGRQGAGVFRAPVFWRVHRSAYGVSEAWAGLSEALDGRTLLRTSTGRAVLCLEADATTGDDCLGR
jgi:hypothetical protein